MKATRYSKQRELIRERLMATDQHPTAEMLYQWLKPDHPALSLGTIYRNLNFLAQQGETGGLAGRGRQRGIAQPAAAARRHHHPQLNL